MRALTPSVVPSLARYARVAAALLAPLAAACSSSGSAGAPGDAPVKPFVTAAECAAGTRPVVGQEACGAVGTTSIPSGFVPRANGWGFEAVLPGAACVGGAKATLGNATCVPSARLADDAFPPAGATLVVSARTDGIANRASLPVYATLDEALAKAAAGDTIAIDEGTYEAATISKSVHLVGRGAEVSVIHGADFSFQLTGAIDVSFASLGFTGAAKCVFLANKKAKLSLDHVYVHGTNDAVTVGNGASVTVTSSVFDGPATQTRAGATNGIHVTYGGHATVRESELRGYQNAFYAESTGSTLDVARSVVQEERGITSDPEGTAQIAAFLGAVVTVDESYVSVQKGRLAVVAAARFDGSTDPTSPGNPPASLTITKSALVHRLLPREAGSALDALDSATLALDDVTLTHDCFVGVGASDDATLTMTHAVVEGGTSANNARSAVSLDKGSPHVTIDGSALVDSTQFAVLASSGDVTITRSLVAGNREVGRFDGSAFMGGAQAIALGRGAQLDLEDTALVGNTGESIYLGEASAKIARSLIRATLATKLGGISSGIVGRDSVLAVADSEIAENGIAMALHGGRALLRTSEVLGHAEAFRLDGVTLVVTTDPILEAAPSQVVASSTRFDRNASMAVEKPLTAE